MDQQSIDEADLPMALPDVMADCLVGIDDLKHGRTVSVEAVTSILDAKLAAWSAAPAMDRDGGHRPQRPTPD